MADDFLKDSSDFHRNLCIKVFRIADYELFFVESFKIIIADKFLKNASDLHENLCITVF